MKRLLLLLSLFLSGCTPEIAGQILQGIAEGLANPEFTESMQELTRRETPLDRRIAGGSYRGSDPVFSGWRVVWPDGRSEITDIQWIRTSSQAETDRLCVTKKMRKRGEHAGGCASDYPPAAIVVHMNGDPNWTKFATAHELWHLKGYWEHVILADGRTWPADSNGRPAPFRAPRPND